MTGLLLCHPGCYVLQYASMSLSPAHVYTVYTCDSQALQADRAVCDATTLWVPFLEHALSEATAHLGAHFVHSMCVHNLCKHDTCLCQTG
jgi:hypothetical protein